jgi:hypothetical protein
MLLADIASGNTGTADTLFLIAAICFGIAVILHVFGAYGGPRTPADPGGPGRPWWGTWPTIFVDAGLCLLAIAWLVL